MFLDASSKENVFTKIFKVKLSSTISTILSLSFKLTISLFDYFAIYVLFVKKRFHLINQRVPLTPKNFIP